MQDGSTGKTVVHADGGKAQAIKEMGPKLQLQKSMLDSCYSSSAICSLYTLFSSFQQLRSCYLYRY